MKIFVLALTLFAPDGGKTEIPIRLWRFATMADCAKSSVFMNRGAIATTQNYACVEYDPNLNVARIAPAQPAKRNS
jgi:hypothetical protein